MKQNNGIVPICHRDRTKVLLAAVMEQRSTGQRRLPDRIGDGPWDLWWTCYRARRSAAEFGFDPWRAPGQCEDCATDASKLAFSEPPGYPDPMVAGKCSCFLEWAQSMREPIPAITWPRWCLTLAMVKPGCNPVLVRQLLRDSHTVLAQFERHLTVADVRRLYPEAYGREYVARRDYYLTSAPITVFVLLASPSAVGKVTEIKADIRRRLGDDDRLRNHLHMPDSPGDAFADLDHLAGTETFLQLYERYECDRAAQRLACYRTLLA